MAARETSTPLGADPVDALVIEVLERLTAGNADALDELCAANPELADTIRSRVAALNEMNLLPSDAAAMAFPERLGDFRLLRRLGGGGMGVVYEAVQESLGRVVALKLIRPEHLYFERSRERFQRETEAVARLAHPGIVAIHTVGEAHGTPYFAMEMIRGGTLGQALEQVAGLAPESLVGADLRAAVLALAPEDASSVPERLPELFEGSWAHTCTRVIARMTEALEHAHGRGVLHRDIKPSNIAVTPEGRVALLDFGLAGLEHELRLTQSGSALGSVLYMAPEQIAGRTHEVDARTDVYALGVTLYELLALQTPFAGADSEQTRAAILDGQPEPLRARYRGVPRDLEIVCLKAMERERSRRYASMSAFGDDLRNVLEGRAVHARPPSAAYRVRRWMWRHPTSTTAALLGALLVTVLPSALYFQQRASSRKLERALAETEKARALAADESQRANDKASEAQQAAMFLVELLAGSDPYHTGRRDVTAREILDEQAERVESELADQPELQALVLERIGESYTNLDLYAQALPPLERALELRRQVHGDDDERTANTQLMVASASRLAGRPGVVEMVRRADEVLTRSASKNLVLTTNVATLLAASLLDEGDTAEPVPVLERARDALDAGEDVPLELRWMVLTMLASTHNRLGHSVEAEKSARAALALEPIPDPRSVPWRAAALDTLGVALLQQGRVDEAEAVFAQLLPEARAFYGPGNVTLQQMELDGISVQQALGKWDGLRPAAERALSALRQGLGVAHHKTLGALRQVADLLAREGRFDGAIALLRDALSETESRAGEDDPACPRLLLWIGMLCDAKGDREAGQEALREGLERLGGKDAALATALSAELALATLDDPARRAEAAKWARANVDSAAEETRDVAVHVLARVALLEQRALDAEALLRSALAPLSFKTTPLVLQSRALLGELMFERGEVEQGCALITEALDALEQRLAPQHAQLQQLRARIESSGAAAQCAAFAAGVPSGR